MYMRTMYFEKKEFVIIDGIRYDISNAVQVDMFNCKSAIVEVWNYLQADNIDMARDFNNFGAWKKDLVKLLKEWDKCYVKHMKTSYPEMSANHAKAMLPLTQLIESNLNFHKLELMIANKEDVPEFRFKALEEEFCKFFTGVC